MTRFAAPPIREGVRGKVRSNSRAGMQHDHLRRDATRGPLETPRRQNRPRRERRSLTGRRGTGKLIIALNGFRGVPRPPFGASLWAMPPALSRAGVKVFGEPVVQVSFSPLREKVVCEADRMRGARCPDMSPPSPACSVGTLPRAKSGLPDLASQRRISGKPEVRGGRVQAAINPSGRPAPFRRSLRAS